jgi:polar amino acid transport system substrate-binding protein
VSGREEKSSAIMPIASQLVPTGTLRAAVWMVPYFAHVENGELKGVIPELAAELARRTGVRLDLVKFENPARIVAAFHDGSLDVTFIGITADRAEAIEFGPVLFEIQTTYLVPASSAIATIADVDRAGVRIAVPAKSAQEAHLTKTLVAAKLLPFPAEVPQRAIEMLKAGEADAVSHVAPMLAAVQRALPGSRILAGSYFNVPIAIGVAKRRPPAVAEFARAFAEEVTRSGFVRDAIGRAGVTGLVVGGGRMAS